MFERLEVENISLVNLQFWDFHKTTMKQTKKNTCSLVKGCANVPSSESAYGSTSSLDLSPDCNDADPKLMGVESVLQEKGLLGYTAVKA